MYRYKVSVHTYINGNHFQDNIKVDSKDKIKEILIGDEITDNGVKKKLEFIKESDPISERYNPQIKERWEQLNSYDRERLVESGIIEKDDIEKRNLKIELYYNK